ncbi:hypothetical protein [Agaribacterium haliotis]|uniref:hypothetical protein n=1 Tax=Agaribacterium haliotis TaxID=2013869 RepID=UPI000BB53442|nr:hypothetical protein [Agaribacterium haliotis]
MNKSLLLAVVLGFSTMPCLAFEIESFEVLGIKVGDSIEVVESKIAPLMPDQETKEADNPESIFPYNYDKFTCGKIEVGKYSCTGSYYEKSKETNSFLRDEKFKSVFNDKGELYMIRHDYTAKVADDYESCKKIVSEYIAGLVKMSGKYSDTFDKRSMSSVKYTDHYANSYYWYDSRNKKDNVSLMVGCSQDGGLMKELSIYAPSYKAKKKPVKAEIR